MTSLGWTIAVIGIVAWLVGVCLDWEELLILVGACLVVFVISLLMTIGRLALTIDLSVEPNRVTAGGSDAVGLVRAVQRPEPTPRWGRGRGAGGSRCGGVRDRHAGLGALV